MEPLRDKRKKVEARTIPNEIADDFHCSQRNYAVLCNDEKGNLFKFDDVKSAVEFYKKYKGYEGHKLNGEMISDKKISWDSWLTFYRKNAGEYINKYNPNRCTIRWLEKLWNDWLFDYTFGDVMEWVIEKD